MQTSAPGGTRLIALYDGHCRICTREAKRLARVAGPGIVQARSFQDEGVLDAFPGITYDLAMTRLHVVTPSGRVFAGAEAVARVAARIKVVGWLAYLYYLPGVRQLAELAYRVIAKNRYKLSGGRVHPGEDACDSGTCALHGAASK